MRSRSYVVLAIGFGILIVLIAVLGFGAVKQADLIYGEMEHAQESYLRAETFRRGITADMYLADILVRDYLLDPSPRNALAHREQLLTIRSSLQKRMDDLAAILGSGYTPGLKQLQNEVQAYWESLDPIFDWTTEDKTKRSWGFLRHNVLPHREAVVELAGEIAKVNQQNLEKERQRIQSSQESLLVFLVRMMGFALALGTVVAALTTYHVTKLERKQESQSKVIAQAEIDLRRLSRRLVQAQETERKALSRELHDEVGQTLTALGMELANIDTARTADPAVFRQSLDDAKRLNAGAMGAIRGLAMGLRPSMLDDLGLEPALQWQGREFSRHTGVTASVHVEGNIDELDETQRTCIYRVVQEALTNCARHAQAGNVTVSVKENLRRLEVLVKDDGIGFDVQKLSRTGLGLIGMKERVQAIGGELVVNSTIGSGTTVKLSAPLTPGGH